MDETAASELLAAAGGGDAKKELARRLTLQAAGAALPDDPLSAMLAVQMAAVHEAALRALRRAEESAGEPETEALYARLAGRLLHLFQRQAKTMARRRETAQLEERAAEAAEAERRRAEAARRRRELEERLWDPDYEDEAEEDEGGEDEDIGEHDAAGQDDDAGAWAAAAADPNPAAHGAPAQPDTVEICARPGALFTRHAADQRAEAQATAGRNGSAAPPGKASRRKRNGPPIPGR